MKELKPNAGRAKIAIALIWATMIAELVLLVSTYYEYALIRSIMLGADVSEDLINASDDRQQIVTIVYLIVCIFSAVTFIQWFRRAYYNLHIKVGNLSFSEGWAAWGWFVPVLFLFRPYQIMQELYMETKKLLAGKNQITSEYLKLNYVSFWWGLSILIILIAQVDLFYLFEEETIEEILTGSMVDMVCCILSIPLGLITVKIVRDYAKVEPLLSEIKKV